MVWVNSGGGGKSGRNGFCLEEFYEFCCFVWNHQYSEKFLKKHFFLGGGVGDQEFFHMFMYIAPSSDHSLLNLIPYEILKLP